MDRLSGIVSAGVGPMIVISACGLLCLAFYNRLTSLVTRLRQFQRERLAEAELLAGLAAAPAPDEAAVRRSHELLAMLEVQTRHVTRRARLVQKVVFCMLSCIACLVACSLCLGLTAVWPSLMAGAAAAFVAGLLCLLAGTAVAMAELKAALDPIELESRFVSRVAGELER